MNYGCAVHAYVPMTNHVHLLLTPLAADSLPRTMQSLGRRYVRHVNAVYRRSGTLWEGRDRGAPIDGEAYFLACLSLHRGQPASSNSLPSPRRTGRAARKRPSTQG